MPYVDHRRSRIGVGPPLARPAWRGPTMRPPPLAQFVLLSMLLHALAIALFGAPAGGSREGRAMWAALQVTLAPAPREEAPRLKLERRIPPPAAPRPRPRHRPALPPAEKMRPIPPMAPLPTLERAAPFVPPLLDRIVTPEPASEPPPPQVPPPTKNLSPPATVPEAPPAEQAPPEPPVEAAPVPPLEAPPIAANPVPVPEAPPTPPVEAPPIEAKPLPVPEATPTPPVEAAPIEAQPLPVPEAAPTPPVEAAPIEAKPLPVPEPTTAAQPAKPVESSRANDPAVLAPATPMPQATAPAPRMQEAPPAPSVREMPAPAQPAAGDESLFKPAAPATGYDPTAPAGPALDLDAIRRRAGEIAREGSGQRALLPFPMPPVPPKKSAMEKAIDGARKPDCRTAYQSMGLAAVVPLVANEFGEGNCRW